MTIGFRIHPAPARPSAELLEQFRDVVTPHLSDNMSRARGVVGFVIDGAIRDVAAFRVGSFPCYARGETHRGPYKEGPGEIHAPVTVGGSIVNPGDIVVGDEDGVVALPAAEAPAILAAARRQAAKEAKALEDIAARRYDRGWVDETLRAKGVIS